MSSKSAVDEINNILAPVLFQVIGSTPESIAESVKNAKLKNESAIGAKLAALSIFSAAVNKATMEQFAATPPMAEIRPALSSNFSVGGKVNMTGLTLLGHCVLTCDIVDNVNFAVEFRRKMGQKHIWAGDFSGGSLSEKQKKIIEEKKRLTAEKPAKLLGSGFFKYIGVDKSAMTTEEADFWKTPIQSQSQSPPMRSVPAPAAASVPAPTPNPAPLPDTAPKFYKIRQPDGKEVLVNKIAYDYYMAINDNDQVKLADSVQKRGVDNFNEIYIDFSNQDPQRKGFGGASRVG